MTKEQIFAKLSQIIKVNFAVPSEHITLDASFRANLGMDSLDLVDLIYFIHQTFDMEEPVQAYHNLGTLNKLVDFLHSRLHAKKA